MPQSTMPFAALVAALYVSASSAVAQNPQYAGASRATARTGTAQPPGDVLDSDIALAGLITVLRFDDTTTFYVGIPLTRSAMDVRGDDTLLLYPGLGSGVVVRLDSKLAWIKNDSVTYEWAQVLSRVNRASVRIADARPVATRKEPSDQAGWMCDAPEPPDRGQVEIAFQLHCAAWDVSKQRKDAAGNPRTEALFTIVTINLSPIDRFLSRPRNDKRLFVSLENAP